MSASAARMSGGCREPAAIVRPARVFVALRIASDIARELARRSEGLAKCAIRGVATGDIHLTLVPPWNETAISEAIRKLADVADSFAPFTLTISHVGYGPDARHPRFLWAECVADEDLAQLRAALMQAFTQVDQRPFRPHVTLARLRDKGRLAAREHPVDDDLSLTQPVVSVELMQSPPPGERGYKVVAALPLRAVRK